MNRGPCSGNTQVKLLHANTTLLNEHKENYTRCHHGMLTPNVCLYLKLIYSNTIYLHALQCDYGSSR